MSDAPPPRADRNLAIDAVKGVGILQVVLFHSLGQGARSFATKGDRHWIAMRALAWAANFAIPLFLLLSAMLLATSFAKSPNVGRFVWRRASRSLWPYLVWSVLYWILRWRTNPRAFDHPAKLAGELLTGKAAYHLYFMVILFQLAIAVPFVVLALRGRRIAFGGMLLLCGALQLGFFGLNRIPGLGVANPGSLLTWYVAPLLMGVWIALHREEWTLAWRREWPLLGFGALVTGGVFAYLSVRLDLGRSVESLSYNSLSVVFRTAASLALLGAAGALAATRLGPPLAALGRYSLPIYLVHPMILRLFGGPRVVPALAHLPFAALWVALAVTALSYAFGYLTSLVRLDVPLFVQLLPRRSAAAPTA